MSSDLTGVTGAVLKVALDAASLRQTVGANNIANANTPGYVPLRVSFEDALRLAMQSGHASSAGMSLPEPRVVADPSGSFVGGASVRIDEEAALLTTNAIHYQALLRGVRGQMDILQTAANDGKR